jgi:hypothetical protein
MASATPVHLPGLGIPAFAIDAAFPVVAVVGILRPRLFVARSVLDTCSADQIDAILAHEGRHVRAHDNLRRAMLAIVPDFVALMPFADRLHTAWHDAAEEAADDAAGLRGDAGRVSLAEALVRVARLGATGRDAGPLPASALYRGEALERRIRRLLGPPPAPDGTDRPAWQRLLPFAAISALCGLALETVHVVIELAVTFLP